MWLELHGLILFLQDGNYSWLTCWCMGDGRVEPAACACGEAPYEGQNNLPHNTYIVLTPASTSLVFNVWKKLLDDLDAVFCLVKGFTLTLSLFLWWLSTVAQTRRIYFSASFPLLIKHALPTLGLPIMAANQISVALLNGCCMWFQMTPPPYHLKENHCELLATDCPTSFKLYSLVHGLICKFHNKYLI